MTTDREILRFVANLPEDEAFGHYVFTELCRHYNWQGTVFSKNDLREMCEMLNEDITETELDDLWENTDIVEELSDSAMRFFEHLVVTYTTGA